ncbi:MAG: MFS transporter [Ruminococcaceae bacterium]|nr:MFS transporter [Oscillospiraceae bacterium]
MKHLNTFRELRSFLLLWGSQTISSLGTAMTEYALTIWVYGETGRASSLTTLTLCIFLPTILFRFAAGTLADRWDKRRIMLCADLFAACGTGAILLLFQSGSLRIWMLYLINILLSFMNAFQAPAAFVATSLLVPQKHYTRASGLQGFSGAAVSILAPVLGSIFLTLGGLRLVLMLDLLSFAVAFLTLFCFIRIPAVPHAEEEKAESFWESCRSGFRYLREHRTILRITLFMTAINFLAKLGNDGMLAPFVLGRTGNNQQILGMVQSSVAIGLLIGSLIVTGMKPARDKVRVIYGTCALIFCGNLVQSLSMSPVVWCAAAIGSYIVAVIMNANLTVFLREQVPVALQGRVFSVRDTLQNGAIPLSLFLGGILADQVFAPLMASDTPLQALLAPLFGSDSGSGVALLVFLSGALGVTLSLVFFLRKHKDTP